MKNKIIIKIGAIVFFIGLICAIISFNDIKAFCDAEIAENVRVDYKENFPNDIS